MRREGHFDMTTKEFVQFLDEKIMNDDDRKNIFSPPLDPQIALDILKDHFLGEDWYTPNPISTLQVNTEVVYEILSKYPGKNGRIKTWMKSIGKSLGKMFGINNHPMH